VLGDGVQHKKTFCVLLRANDRPLSVVGVRRKQRRCPVTLTQTAWVQFLPARTYETCRCCSAKSSLMKLACLRANDALLRYVEQLSECKLLSQENLESLFLEISIIRSWCPIICGDDEAADCRYVPVPLCSSGFQMLSLIPLITDCIQIESSV
jgi:hypothetical protein